MKSLKPSKTSLPPAKFRVQRLSIKKTLTQTAKDLASAGITSAQLDAELLLAHVLKKERVFVLAHPELTLTARQSSTFSSLISQRSRQHPVAYLLDHKEFYGLDFIVTSDVLVPRPESELIVDIVKNMDGADSFLLDVGTGSGCIPITLAPYFNRIIALDISKKALGVAKQNAKKHGRKNVRFIHSDLLSNLPKLRNFSKLIITANLPYLTATEIKKEKSISREPRLALYGGKDGLALYKKLTRQVTELKQYYSVPITVLCEINPGQKAGFKKLWNEKVEFVKDLAGKTRIGIIII